jgi:hypothetical protein
MMGAESHIQKAIEDPDVISPSTRVPTSSYAFQACISTGDVRVLVSYDDVTLVPAGSTSGVVQTAYPVDTITYNAPQIGPPIYVRATAPPGNGSDQKEGGNE